MPFSTPANWLKTSLNILLVCLLYVFLGRIALLLAVPPGYAMAIYPPAGLAVAAVLMGGKRLLPGVGLGSLLLNLWISWEQQQEINATAIGLVLAIASGAMLHALCARWLIKKVVGYPLALDNNRSILQFMFLGSLLSCMVSASIGVAALYVVGIVEAPNLLNNWFTWWLGDSLGVLIIAPTGLILFGEPRSIWRARRVNVLLPLMLTLMLVVVLFVFVRNWEQERLENEFHDRAERISTALQARLDYHLEVQKSVVALYASINHIDEAQFTRFVAQPISNYSALRAICWLPHVAKEGRNNFFGKNSAVPKMDIQEFGADGKLQIANKRDEYYPVAYVSPVIGNTQIQGVDLAAIPALRKAINEARDIGLVVASSPLMNVAQDKKVAALVSPVYHSQQSNLNVEARRKALHGVVVSLLDLGDVVDSVIGAHDKGNVLVRLSDSPNLLEHHDYLNTISAELDKKLSKDKRHLNFNLDFAGRELQLSLQPSKAYLQRQQAWAAWVALVGGMLFAGIVGMYLLVVSGRSFGIEALVVQRTRQLHDSEQRLLAILENAADGILTVDGSGQLALFNRAICRLLQYEPSMLSDQFFDTLFLENGLALLIANAIPTKEGQNRTIKNVDGRRADGSLVPLELAVAKVGIENQSLYIVVVHDLTERKRIDQLKGDFVSAVSHELRTPLTSIRGSLGLLVGGVCGKLPDKMDKLVKLASDNADRLSILINDLLDFEKLELGGMPFHFALFDMRKVVAQAIEVNQGYAQKFSIKLLTQSESDTPLMVRIDEGRMIQVLSNLLSNAIKFSHSNTTVDVVIKQSAATVSVYVTDHGTGIAEDFKPRIFQKFSQADGSVTKKYSGTGLGLSIAKMMVEKMGGEIGFSSDAGMGASFYVHFPLHIDPAA